MLSAIPEHRTIYSHRELRLYLLSTSCWLSFSLLLVEVKITIDLVLDLLSK